MLNPFIPQKREYKHSPYVSSDIVSIELGDEVKKLTDDNTKSEDFVVIKVIKETSRVSANDYVQSFKDDVGIENILKRVALTGDISLLNQRSREVGSVDENGYEVLQDYTGVPGDVFEAAKIVKSGRDVFASLPADLVKGRSFTEFVETATDDEIQAYMVACYEASKKASEGDK